MPIDPRESSTQSHWITSKALDTAQSLSIPRHIFIGIDFGTSTTVVSKAVAQDQKVNIETLTLSQPDEFGAEIRHHLINSVLAWKNNSLIWGQDAYRLKPLLIEGRTVFSSFKMRLGLSIGPTYPETRLAKKQKLPWFVETAADASRELLKGMLASLKKELQNDGIENYRFALSVPASFEANQRRDLLKSLADNGVTEEQCCLIDEPNAAFLSFMYDCMQKNIEHPLIDRLSQKACKFLVYDFGAGTCDISILLVDTRNGSFTSQNLAISKFTALGGDDIDRAIARHILLPQLLKSCVEEEPDSRDIEEKIIPRLQATAEKLKISATRWIINKKIDDFESLSHYLATDFEDLPIAPFKVRKNSFELAKPTMTLRQFKTVLDDFMGEFDGIHSPMHLLSPVVDALDKANLSREDVDAVLFIGGSCLNPLVQSCIMNYMNEHDECVESIVPVELRAHVSLGAAIHSFSYHALGLDFIKPITSESIFVITKNDLLETIIPACSAVPTIQAFHTTLMVAQDSQSCIEIPICVGSKHKILGILTIHSKRGQPFKVGSCVEVSASINHEKLLNVTASINGVTAEASILNPLANEELTKSESLMLKAKQNFNQAVLDHDGRPPAPVVIKYADACLTAGAYELAADLYIAIERLDPSQDFSTTICFAYDRAGKSEKSKAWAEKAYKRKPNATNAYNLSCEHFGEKKEEYLRLSLKHDEQYSIALFTLGRILHSKGDPEGKELLERALNYLRGEIDDDTITSRECENIIQICNTLDDHQQLKASAQTRKKQIEHHEHELYSSDHLVATLRSTLDIKKD